MREQMSLHPLAGRANSGGFQPVLTSTTTSVTDPAHFLASEHYMVKRAGATYAASAVAAVNGRKILKRGTFVTKITSGPDIGKYGPYDAGATDGRQTADANTSGFTLEGLDLTDGDVIAGHITHGSVLEARVTPTPLLAAMKTAIAGRITLQ